MLSGKCLSDWSLKWCISLLDSLFHCKKNFYSVLMWEWKGQWNQKYAPEIILCFLIRAINEKNNYMIHTLSLVPWETPLFSPSVSMFPKLKVRETWRVESKQKGAVSQRSDITCFVIHPEDKIHWVLSN